MKIDLSIFMSCKAGFLLTISLFGQQEFMTYEGSLGVKFVCYTVFIEKT